MTLADLTRGQWGVVEMVSAEAVLRQRLFDLGLVPGTLVQVRFIGRKETWQLTMCGDRC